MTKKAKVYVNGIEITSSIFFIGWQPGFEYTKNLNFKNLNTKTVKITFKVPQTKYFTTLLPNIISLSPGTTFTLPLTFRPLTKVEYKDVFELYQLDFEKTVRIPILAKLPEYKIEIPDKVNLGLSSVFDESYGKLKLNNLSELDTSFEFDVKEPFTVMPNSGELKANSSLEILFKFQPKAALVYKSNAILKYGDLTNLKLTLFKSFELSGIGKYPHIIIESDEGGDKMQSPEIILNFENIVIGQTATRYFTLINLTEVKTSFHIEKDTNISPFENSFNLLHDYGTLQPFEKQKIAITYSPTYSTSEVIYNYFNVFSSGNLCKNRITCKATNIVPEVSLDKQLLDFGRCDLNKNVFRALNLINNSQSQIVFQFDIDNDFSAFNFSLTNGVLEPNETKLIQISFKPQHPIIYYKRIFCLVQNHNVLAIDLIGSSSSELIKPPEISKKQLNVFNYLKKQNLINNPPELLLELYQQNKILIETNLETIANTGNKENSLEEYLNQDEDTSLEKQQPCIRVDKKCVDFESVRCNSANGPIEKAIQVFNETKGKLVVYWNSVDNTVFSISPLKCEIPPMKSYSFRIKFSPEKNDQLYANKLEGFAFYKSMADYTFAEPKFILPPWCLTISCLGHTFHPSSDEHFLPRYLVDNENIIFPVGLKDTTVYRSFIVKNTASDYPLIYHLQNSEIEKSWSIKPRQGLIKKNQYQIFILKFNPKDENIIDKCELMLNYQKNNAIELPIFGGNASPEISMENNGILYFPPTCKNNSLSKSFEIVNLTPSKVNYEWKIPFESRNLFSVDQIQFHLDSFQKKKCLWTFSPGKLEKYNHKIGLLAWVGENRQFLKPYSLRILASCINGSLQSNEMYKDFGNVIVGSSISSELIVINNNDCSLDFEIFVKQTTDDSLANKSLDNHCILEFENSSGHIEARSKLTIRCRLRPVRLINYQFTIEYKILYPNDRELAETEIASKEILCYMTTVGVYPKLNITDIKALGSASNLNKDYLWRLLCVNELNSSMGCEPNPEELVYSIATRQEANRRLINQFNRPIIDMNFIPAPLKSDDTEIIFFMQNTGLVSADWVLLYPKDLLLELEYWAQNGDYSVEELEQMKIQDNKLFSIEPTKGHLEPREIVRITITYKYLFVGQSKLPILMKIAKGREIMLNLIGTTVSTGEAFVYFPVNKYEFEPVEIGLNEYPIQVYELYNGGEVPAQVEIDCSMIEEANQNNYMANILKCLSEEVISIAPGSCFETKWRFSPIEAKTYQVDIVFKVDKHKLNVVTFKLVGYDKRKLNNVPIERKYESIPENLNFTLPNQLASLSVDRMILGNVPIFSRERKIIFIKNNSYEHKVSFTWHVTNPDHIRFIRIQPSRGTIDINESRMCKLTFISKGRPQFYNIDLICETKNESEMEIYRKKIELWKREQVRQYEEFLIEENELEDRLKKIDNNTEEIKEPKLNKSDISKMASQLGIHKFKTIPPIVKNSLLEETNVDRTRKERDEKKKWKKPQPPVPFLNHLNVIATTQYFDEYLETSNSIKNSSVKYIDTQLGSMDSKPIGEAHDSDRNQNSNTISANEEEKNAVEYIVCNLLRSLVNDKSFHVLTQRVKDEEIPYFFQYAQENDTKISTKHIEQKEIKASKKDKKADMIKNIKTSSNFGSMIESILENTLSNVLTEAFNKEFALTNRPRLIALPPKEPNKSNSSQHQLPPDRNAIQKVKSSTSSIASSSVDI